MVKFNLSGCFTGPGISGAVAVEPVRFLGGTVLSFNASLGIGPTQESTLNVDIVNDCAVPSGNPPEGDFFYGYSKIGSPVFFSVCEAMGLNPGGTGCFEFGGILTNITAQQGSGGRTYNAKVVDPRSLLENALVVVGNSLSGPIKHRNYFNVYSYYEYNVLPPEKREEQPEDLLLPNSPGGSDGPITPENPDDKCDLFGKADSDSRGMTYRSVLQALKAMDPLIYAPNYSEPYNPLLTGRFLQIMGGKLLHEDNVMKLDLEGFPDPPSYYRVPGPSISILQLLSNVCDIMGREFIVKLDRPDAAGEPYVIRIETKKIDPPEEAGQNQLLNNIMYYDGKAIDFSYGKELRIDKSRTILLGEQEHKLYASSKLVPYFGEDKAGDPIVAYAGSGTDCGFLVDIELDELNYALNCPLFDPETTGIITGKVTISEFDIRTALSSIDFWKRRTFTIGIEPSGTEPAVLGEPGHFNYVIRYNYPDNTNKMMRDTFRNMGGALETTAENINQSGTHANRAKAFVDYMNMGDGKYARTIESSRARDIERIYEFIANIGKTYYGKKYLVTIDEDFCAKPAGTYDENYFGLTSGVPPSGISYSGSGCEPTIPIGQIYREKIYTHVPTNAGGWVDPCVRVLGLNDDNALIDDSTYDGASLDFFREEDTRIGAFARFDTADVAVTLRAGFIEDGDIVDNVNTTTAVSEFIAGQCGELDISKLNFDEYLMVRTSGGICEPPTDAETKWNNPNRPPETGVIIANQQPITVWVKGEVEEKIYIVPEPIEGTGSINVTKAVFSFGSPCFKKICGDQTAFSEVFMMVSAALGVTAGMINSSGEPYNSGIEILRKYPTICGIPIESGLKAAESSVDAQALNNKGFCPAADIPVAVVIPVRSNITTYGPWYSPNFETSAGGVALEQDSDLAPWNYGSTSIMNLIASDLVKEAQVALSETETGSVNYPYWPELRLGFLENGPNLSNINVNFGNNGITTNYNFQTYTPKFGSLKNLENQQLKDSTKNRIRASKIIRSREIKNSTIDRKLKRRGGGQSSAPDPKNPRTQGTSNRIMIGEMYDFQYIFNSGNNIAATGQRTIVATETLEKTTAELNKNYQNKAFMSLDGLYSPISISGDGNFPMFSIRYTGYPDASKSAPLAPMPPFIVQSSLLDIKINQQYLNPLTNPFSSGNHHHHGSGVGHAIDIVGREKDPKPGGIINNFFANNDPSGSRYSKDYRFLGLRGPLVLHSWGYDTQGKPIPNAVDDWNDIKKSGIFANSGLKDEFYDDWLQKPTTWPVAPVDLRFDRERGLWVSPPQHKIVVAQATENIDAYGTGSGILINEKDGVEYGQKLYDSSGNLVSANDAVSQAKIEIQDRIGASIADGDKAYAYFDSFSSKYLLLAGGGGGSTIKLGKFMNQWPSLSNVKEPMNAIKDVHLYKPTKECPSIAVSNYQDKTFCPWTLQPEMEQNESGVFVPKTVKVMNLFANVASPEYQAKWCMFTKIDGYYYLLAAEC